MVWGDRGATASEQTHRFASGRKREIHSPRGRERGWSGPRGRREHGGRRRRGHTGHRDIGAWQQPQPALASLDPAGQRDPSAGRQGGRETAREAPARPGTQRGHGLSYPCRPRARRRLWSRQSSRNPAPASEEFRAVKYLLKAAMAQPARARKGDAAVPASM